MDFLPIEMFFDHGYSDQLADELSDRLAEPLGDLLTDRFKALRHQLEVSPKQKTAGNLECASFDLDGLPEPVYVLAAIRCDQAQILECLVFVGPREIIEKKAQLMRSSLIHQLSRPGLDGFMVETSKPGCQINWKAQEDSE